MTLTEIREAIGALPRVADGRLKRVPEDLRREILFHASKEGKESVGQAIGLASTSIYGWEGKKYKQTVKRQRFRQLKIVPGVVKSSFVVEGPMGLRFTGLSLSEAAKLVREVSREF